MRYAQAQQVAQGVYDDVKLAGKATARASEGFGWGAAFLPDGVLMDSHTS